MELVVTLGADSLLLAAGLGALLLESSDTGLSASSLSSSLELLLLCGEGVKASHGRGILEGVLLGGLFKVLRFADITESGLDGVRVDNASQIADRHAVAVELVSALLNTLNTVGTEDFIESLKSVSSVDDEAAEVTTRSELEQVEAVDIASINTRQVASSALHKGVLITIDDEGTTRDLVARVTHLARASTEVLLDQ